jgi:hypothetical protein
MPESSAARYGQDPDTQTTIVQRAWPIPPGQDTGPRISAAADTWPVLDVRRLRHPSEPSRFALAASASILLVGTGLLVMLRLAGVLAIGGLAAFLVLVFGLVWWVQQVRRAKLLGGTARATPETFPVLSAAAGSVKRQVGYARPVEIFVAAHAGQPVLLTSFFGTRILLMDGDLVADLLKPGNRPQLDFILATYLGALKVKALAWAPLYIAIDALGLPHVLNFFIAPWERATVYTGDQVAATCCGSLDESVTALNRLLVGKDLADSVGMTGLMNQAAAVRRRWLPRLQQLYSRSPHLTNRYLNLLSFTTQSAPAQARAFRGGLHPTADVRVEDVSARLTRLHERGPRRTLAAACITASVAVLGVAALAILSLIPQNNLVTMAGIFSPSTPSSAAHTPTPAATPSPAPGTPATQQATGNQAAALQTHVPPAFAASCGAFAPQPAMDGVSAAITCRPAEGPASIQYYQYADTAGMNTAFEATTSGLTQASACDQPGQRGTYHFTDGPGPGQWACYYTTSHHGQLIWTSTSLNILAVANDPAQTPQQLADWFFSPADTGPD